MTSHRPLRQHIHKRDQEDEFKKKKTLSKHVLTFNSILHIMASGWLSKLRDSFFRTHRLPTKEQACTLPLDDTTLGIDFSDRLTVR